MDALTFLILAGAIAVALALFDGIVSMAHGGEADARESHRLMFKRLGWQAATVLLLLAQLR
jgi:hypothetical protein